MRLLPRQNQCSVPLGTQCRATLPRARAITCLLPSEAVKMLPGQFRQLAAPTAPCKVSSHPQRQGVNYQHGVNVTLHEQ